MKVKLLYLLLLFSNCLVAQIPTNGLQARYDFTGNNYLLNTASGTTLTVHNSYTNVGALARTHDRFNTSASSAVQLNGGHLQGVDVNTGANFSYSFWIKTSTNDGFFRTIIDDSQRNSGNQNYSGNKTGYQIALVNGRVWTNMKITTSTGITGYIGSQTGTLVADGNWHHIVVKYSLRGSTLTSAIYLDGIQQEQKQSSGVSGVVTGMNNNTPITIGNVRTHNATQNQSYQDSIDEILIYNRDLSDVEISTIANQGNFCHAVDASNIYISNITETEATVTIAANAPVANYDIAYVKRGEPIANATIVNGLANGGSTVINGLTKSTQYDIYLRKNCGTGNVSGWSLPKKMRSNGVIFVSKNATGNNDGSSWINAYTNIREALVNSNHNAVIWVAKGVYTPDTSNRNIAFTIAKHNLKIYGGFAGNETQLNQRNFKTNVTIASGDLQANDQNQNALYLNVANTTRNDNSHRVFTIAGENALIDGFTISDGQNQLTYQHGAAIYKIKSVKKLTVKNCIVKNNLSRYGGAGIAADFDIHNTGKSRGTLHIENCEFTNNMARYGTAIYSLTRANSYVDAIVINSLFNNNHADAYSTTEKGFAGSSSWFRNIGSNADFNIELINNTYVNNLDLGEGNANLNNYNRSTVGVSKNATDATSVINAKIANCIFWNNKAVSNVTAPSVTHLYLTQPNGIEILNSIDEDNFSYAGITTSTNNSNVNPLFVSATNFSLRAISPAIDSGDNTQIPNTIIADLAGNNRIYNSIIDIGAYEYGASPVASIKKIDAINFTMYPNPVSKMLTIQTKLPLKNVIIYNLQGKKVSTTNTKKVNVNNLSNGIYILKITTETGKTGIQKFIKN